jgi:hypothetical protein
MAMAVPWESATTKFMDISGRLIQSLSVIAVMALCMVAILDLTPGYRAVKNSFGLFIIFGIASLARMI